jgi:hypothetical protein
MKVLHITPNDRTAHIVQSALAKEQDEVLVRSFPVSLLYGHLPYRINEASIPSMSCNGREQELSAFLKLPFSDFNKVILWHSNDAESMLLLYWLCSLNIPLYYIDAASSRYLLREKCVMHHAKIIPMGNMSDMEIRHLLNTEIKMTPIYRRYASLCWYYHCCFHNGELRILNHNGSIVRRSTGYYDDLILDNCPNAFMNISYTIGLTINAAGRNGNIVHEWFVYNRIRHLISSGLLTSRKSETSAKISLPKSSLPAEAFRTEIKRL